MRKFVIALVCVAVLGGCIAALSSGGKDVPADADDTPAVTSTAPPKTTAKPAGTVLLNIKGSGTKTTQKFSAKEDWDLRWSFDCANFGTEGNFIVDPTGDGFVTPVNQLGKRGSGVEHYHSGGTYYLEVISECDWTLKAVAA
jgi:hypothetical protein